MWPKQDILDTLKGITPGERREYATAAGFYKVVDLIIEHYKAFDGNNEWYSQFVASQYTFFNGGNPVDIAEPSPTCWIDAFYSENGIIVVDHKHLVISFYGNDDLSAEINLLLLVD